MHRGLPLVESIKLVGSGSFEMEFGTSGNSTTLVEFHAVYSWTSGLRSGLR